MNKLVARFTMGTTFLEVLVPVEKLTLTEIGTWMIEECRALDIHDDYRVSADCRVAHALLIHATCAKYSVLKAHAATLPTEPDSEITSEFLKDLTAKLETLAANLEVSTQKIRSQRERLVAKSAATPADHVVANWRKDELP